MSTITQNRYAASTPMVLFLLVAAFVGLAASGAYAFYQLMAQGHAAFNTNSLGMMWGLPIVTYDFFLLSSTGLVMLSSAWTVFRIEAFEPIARRTLWLAIAALLGAVLGLMIELGSPLKALYLIPFSFQTSAPLFWKVWGVIVYVIALAILVFSWLLKGRQALPSKRVALVALLAAIYITFVAGGVYGWLAMRPFWFGGEISLAFLVESLLGAVTFIIIFTHMAHAFNSSRFDPRTTALFAGQLGALFAVLLLAHAFFVVSRLVAGLWSNADGMQVWHLFWSQPTFQAQLWLGIAIPFVLMVSPSLRKVPMLQLIAAALSVVGLFAARYDFVIGGQMVPLFKGSWAHGLLHYFPSATEWAVLGMAICLANLINALGEKFLDLDA
ncbi:polysulfide reductase NrfD [Alcaligenaceae bacterium]|nr:polysulfide reductase NrfD [Alcaligenaceae bacterium]